MSKKKQKFCNDIYKAIKDERDATVEYATLALQSLELDDKTMEAVSIIMEKIRDDEKSHKEALEKIGRVVCPIKNE